jgi:hypothetical protein
MGSDERGEITDGGIAARMRGRVSLPIAVAPSFRDGFNAIRPSLSPIACWRIDDHRFAFDSSFPHPTASLEFATLRDLRPPGVDGAGLLSVFGHADPTGAAAYNKTLSGRRALAVYALLTRRTDLWDRLHENPFGGDRWGIRSLQTILAHLGHDPGPVDDAMGPHTRSAVEEFQTSRGLAAHGSLDKPTRLELYLAYMDALCAGENDSPFRYQASDFLGKGSAADHRVDVQGCSAFNPIVVFSSEETRTFAKEENHASRNAENAPNRRVLVYVFPADANVAADSWPCPSAEDGPDACRAHFWSDADARLRPRDARREIRKKGKTFGCKFYDGFARLSLCESTRSTVRIWLLDANGRKMPNTRYRFEVGPQQRDGVTDESGMLIEPEIVQARVATLQWHELAFAFSIDSDKGDPKDNDFLLARMKRMGVKDTTPFVYPLLLAKPGLPAGVAPPLPGGSPAPAPSPAPPQDARTGLADDGAGGRFAFQAQVYIDADGLEGQDADRATTGRLVNLGFGGIPDEAGRLAAFSREYAVGGDLDPRQALADANRRGEGRKVGA